MERLANDCSSPRVTNIRVLKTRDGEEDDLISAIASSDRGAMNSCDWFFFFLSFFSLVR